MLVITIVRCVSNENKSFSILEGFNMKLINVVTLLAPVLLMNTAWADSNLIDHYKTLTLMKGDWKLSPANQQEGGATKKGPAAKLIDTDAVAMSFKVIGKGSTVQESLLPGTGKEMATMYHCNEFKNCTQIDARHYCAKQNQPELVLDTKKSTDSTIVMNCDMRSPLCNSTEGHIHNIKHELSQGNNHLKTTYTSYKNSKVQKKSIYHFDRI